MSSENVKIQKGSILNSDFRIELIFVSVFQILSRVMALLVIMVAFFFSVGRNPITRTYGKVL